MDLLQMRMVNVTEISAYVSIVLFSLLAVMQIGVAMGIVPIKILWGGSQHQLTIQLRIASIIAASVLVSFALIIRKRTVDPSNGSFRTMSQCITFYMALNTLGNFLSHNSFEKYVEGTLTVILTVSTGIVGFASELRFRDSYIDID